jgi:hypothetical protein
MYLAAIKDKSQSCVMTLGFGTNGHDVESGRS